MRRWIHSVKFRTGHHYPAIQSYFWFYHQ